MSSAVIRKATAADQEALGKLGELLVREHHEFDRLRFIAPLPELPRRYGEFLMTQAERPDMFVLVAEVHRAVAGYVYAGMEGTDYMALRGPAGALYDLVVEPEQRRKRIGTRLMDAALAELARRGAPRVVLFTADKNHAAQAMFAGAGFRRTMIEMTREL